MDQDSVHMVAASKVPMLKPGEYELWRMRMEQYIQMIDYSLWEVIENGNAPQITKVVEDAKSLLQVVEKRFGGNAATKKTQRNLLKQQYENFTASSSEVLDQTFDRLQKLISQLEIHGEMMLSSVLSLQVTQTIHNLTMEGLPIINPELFRRDDLIRCAMAMLTIRARRFLKNTGRKLTVNGLESVEARLLVYTKNKSVYEEDIKVLKREIHLREVAITELRRKLELAQKQKDKIQLTVENFENSSKNLSKLIDCQIVDKCKTAKASKAKPKAVRKNNGASIIEDWVSDNEEDDVPQAKIEKKIFKPSFVKIDFVKAKQTNKTAMKTTKQVDCKKNTVPRAVLLKSGLVSINTARQNISKTAVSVNTARQVNTAHIKTTVNAARSMSHLSKTAHSTVKRPIQKNTDFKNSNFNQRVNTVRDENVNAARPKAIVNTARPKAVVNAVKGNNVNAVKALACWVWKPKTKVLDHGNPQMDLQDQGVIDSGCSRHMTGNMSYLTDYEEINGGYVAFRGNPKGGKITGRGTIKTGNLDFENVYFVKELKFNLFSVSQMCDKNNSVLFNDTECIVLSPNFNESQVLLKVPRKKNMYSVNLKNIIPKGGLTCLFAKATSDESKLWHKRLGHINSKTMNKQVKGNLVRGFPIKLFENNQTCVACQKGKQHRASCKSKTAEAVNTACYVQNRVLVTKPHNKTLYELFLGRKSTLDFMRPFGCPVTILNTIDHLGKFDGKVDEGFFVGYSINSKAFRVFNSRTRIVEENLHVQFSENIPNIAGSRPNYLFDIDALTKSMNYKPVVAGNQSNGNAGTKACDDTGKARMKTVPGKDYIMLPLWTADPPFSQSSKISLNAGFKPSGDDEKKVTKEPGKEGGDLSKEDERDDQEKDASVNNTNNVNAASTN
ncbi:ribonuclease H-like domain-containing protein [Tanacetum coccineum]